jgi:serine/threonine protein kinase/tetratricopeptide (TPR) repeat protein
MKPLTCQHSTERISSHDPEVIELLDEYLASLEAGKPEIAGELIARRPDLEHELRGYFQSIDFLQKGASQKEDSLILEDWNGRILGDYEIFREVGRGGMGIVYEARQRSLDRRVALKVLPFAAVLDRKQITRFNIEAHAAAQLQHPHIVPVYGVGCDRDIHFYSMQFIEGQSLDKEIERRKVSTQPGPSKNAVSLETVRGFSTDLSPNSRGYVRWVARLGIQAAEALQHAHDCGVVHRDVKPSNLLLDCHGKLWVTDFGLAQLPNEAGLTLTGTVLGTVRYMSPEQATGKTDLVDHRSDIYSLGVTLYELLTLRSAFDADNREEFTQQIEQAEPPAPRRINSAIPVDMETIVMKALSKRRSQRYATAQAMADDLRRFVGGAAITARRPSLVDRTAKWATRHKGPVLCAMAVLILMLFGACVAVLFVTQEQRNTQAALMRAENNLRQARNVLGEFGVLTADRLAELPGAEPLREEVLSRTLAYYDRLIEQGENETALAADRATTWFKAGELRERLGRTDAALDSYNHAALLFEGLSAKHPANDKLRRDLAACYNNIALVRSRIGDAAAARHGFETAIHVQRDLVRGSANVKDSLALAAMLHNLGGLSLQAGNVGKANELHQEALAIEQRLREQAPKNPRVLRELAMSYNNSSYLCRDRDLTRAVEHNQRALAILRKCCEAPDASSALQSDLALSLNNHGALLSRSGDWQGAKTAYEEAVVITSRLTQAAPSIVNHRRDLAVSWNNLGRVQMELGETTGAKEAFNSARDSLLALIQTAPDELSFRSSLGGVLNNLGRLYECEGALDQAAVAYEKAMEHQLFCLQRAPNVKEFRVFLGRTCGNYATMLRTTGNEARANDVDKLRSKWSADLAAPTK